MIQKYKSTKRKKVCGNLGRCFGKVTFLQKSAEGWKLESMHQDREIPESLDGLGFALLLLLSIKKYLLLFIGK
ncbi:MAG TPA: hypothetical protein VN922_01740 [Bacteroidia bacterium]|nr:hypothetical protein [Bacteroidia bacterium]